MYLLWFILTGQFLSKLSMHIPLDYIIQIHKCDNIIGFLGVSTGYRELQMSQLEKSYQYDHTMSSFSQNPEYVMNCPLGSPVTSQAECQRAMFFIIKPNFH